MLRFESDYLEGALPEIMEKLNSTNFEQTSGYGNDDYCAAAAEKIKALCECPDANVHFMVGGTQTNLAVIATALRAYQGVIAATTAHIAEHETGAIEATGHKILTIPTLDGKLSARDIDALAAAHYADPSREHAPQPAMVYISQPTETGTVYTLPELEEISAVCKKYNMYLYVDGARLACALALERTPQLPDLARLCDVFYIGGTKHGALFGEALVMINPAIDRDFRYIMKQRGALFAKGRLLGLQFDALFTDGLYYKVGRRENALAERIKSAFEAKGVELIYPSTTNQLFVKLNRSQFEALKEKYSFSLQYMLPDGGAAVRFCTSWATTDLAADALIADIEKF